MYFTILINDVRVFAYILHAFNYSVRMMFVCIYFVFYHVRVIVVPGNFIYSLCARESVQGYLYFCLLFITIVWSVQDPRRDPTPVANDDKNDSVRLCFLYLYT